MRGNASLGSFHLFVIFQLHVVVVSIFNVIGPDTRQTRFLLSGEHRSKSGAHAEASRNKADVFSISENLGAGARSALAWMLPFVMLTTFQVLIDLGL